MTSTKRIIWVDVETTGTEAFSGDSLLEVACLITDSQLNILDETGYHAVVKYSPLEITKQKLRTSDYVLKMHTDSGLWDKLSTGTERGVVDTELLDYMKSFVPDARSAPLGGNSITLDRNFLDNNLPKSFAHIHYRSRDISTMVGELEDIMGDSFVPFEKKLAHEAMSDIRESIAEARYLRSLWRKVS